MPLDSWFTLQRFEETEIKQQGAEQSVNICWNVTPCNDFAPFLIDLDMDKIALIKAEIERLYNDKSYSEDRWDMGYDCACEDIMSFLSTLESEEPDKSLEEAAEESGLEYAPIISGEALDLSGQFYETDDVDWPSRCGFIKGFKAGAKWAFGQRRTKEQANQINSLDYSNRCFQNGVEKGRQEMYVEMMKKHSR